MSRTLLCGLAAATLALTGLAMPAGAQIGSGWTSYTETFTIQTSGSGSVSGNTFKITSTSGSTKDRAERRYQTLSSGSHQWQGDCTVNSFSGDRICVKQTFQENAGPWNMVGVQHSGTIYEIEGGNSLGTFKVGTSFRVNTILSISSNSVQVYINGSLKETKSGGSGPYYNKCGTYRTDSGTAAITATWANVKFWKK